MAETLKPGTEVWEKRPQSPGWKVKKIEDGDYRCYHPDGDGGVVERVFKAEELETRDERNQRGADEDAARQADEDRMMGREKRRRPLYDV